MSVAALQPTPTQSVTVVGPRAAPEDDGFTFGDFLDVINPLHHIPIVGTLYRELTGDTLDTTAKLAGATLFAGPVGLLAAIGAVRMEEETGKEPLMWVADLMFGGGDDPAPVNMGAAAVVGPDGQPLTQTAALAGGSVAPTPQTIHADEARARFMQQQSAAPQPAAATPPSALPQLSPAAFEALMSAHGQPPAPAPGPAAAQGPVRPAGAASGTATSAPADLAGQMMQALDRYQAMSRARTAPMGPPVWP